MSGAAESITRHFNGDWHGSYGAIPTPGHSAKDRGCTVKDVEGGDVLFCAHNDDGFNASGWRDLKDHCRRAGLLPEFERTNDNGPASDMWRTTGVYEYVGADGAVAYRTVRKEKSGEAKRFVAQRPDGSGGWVNGLGDIERVLYRLPEILAAGSALTVYVVEGERKADKLAGWGLVATAVAFGAKGWRDSYAAALTGRNIAILPDNDEPGRAFAARVRDSVEQAGGTAIVVDLPGLGVGEDIIDWSGRGGSAFDLKALTEAAANQPAATFEVADLALWARTSPTPKAFLMAPYLPREDVIIVTGDGGTNKSTLALQISACAAAGKPMLGMDVEPCRALYVTAEDDNRENHWRLAKIAQAIGTTLDALVGRLHIVSLRGHLNNELATFDYEGKLRTAPAYALLKATIAETGAKLLTLDNVAHLFAGNENDRSQVTAFINLLYQLCGEFGVTILLIAHRNKTGDSYSGSTAWLNAVRSQVLLERGTDVDADARRMSLGKANYARAGENIAFRWHNFALVRDADLPDDQRRELAMAMQTTADNTAFLTCLAERTRQRRAVSDGSGTNYAPAVFAQMPEGQKIGNDRMKAAMERLFRINRIEKAILWRDRSKSRDVSGLREVADGSPTATPDRFPTTLPDRPQPVLPTDPPHTPSPKGDTGAAPEAAAPQGNKPISFAACERPTNHARMILAPGEGGDDVEF